MTDPSTAYERYLQEWEDQPQNKPHITTCRYCEHGTICPTCGKELFCVEDMEWYDPDEPFKSTECRNYKCIEYPAQLNGDD